MISSLKGIVLSKEPMIVDIEVNDVGYHVSVPMTTFYTLPKVGQEVFLYTHLLVREDAHLLYGFASESERHLFRSLIKVNGVGAKIALAILSGIETDEFIRCIQAGDSGTLIRIPGVGKKMADRLIVEMRDKLAHLELAPSTSKVTELQSINMVGASVHEAISALIALGYKPQEASKHVHSVEDQELSTEELIRTALKNLVK